MTFNSLRKMVRDGQEILVIDFSDLKESDMMQLISDSRSLLLKEKQQQKLLVILNINNYVTPKVMRHLETHRTEAIKYSKKQAVVGLTFTQRMILKGYNIVFNRDIRDFGNQEDAIKYLLED